MRKLNDNEWLLINEIIYKINTIESIDEVQTIFLNLIKHLICFDSALFYLKGPTEKDFLSNPICINYDIKAAKRYIEIGKEKDYTLGIMQCSKCMICKETDLLPDQEREKTEYYKLFLVPQNLHYGVQVTLVFNNMLVGVISLLRKKDGFDFNEKDVFILDILKDHIAFRLHNNSYRIIPSAYRNNINFKQFEEKYELTRRELDVLKLVVNDFSNKEISDMLIISNNTIKKHIINIYKKFNVSSRLQLFRVIDLYMKENDNGEAN